MKIKESDIEYNSSGFIVHKVKRLSDAKLNDLSELLEEIVPIWFTNIDDMGCLSVGFRDKFKYLSTEEKGLILEAINTIKK